jgi:hypothetical protein
MLSVGQIGRFADWCGIELKFRESRVLFLSLLPDLFWLHGRIHSLLTLGIRLDVIEGTLKDLCNFQNLIRMSHPRLDRDDYTVGWICALPVELKAARAMLGEQHKSPVQRDGDNNSYTVGRIGVHNVVIAVLPAGRLGTSPAATIGSEMNSSFRNLRFALTTVSGVNIVNCPPV